jgi:hypothetical protein
VGAKDEAEAWRGAVQAYAKDHDLRYEDVGGLNPKDGPVALCVGGTNRLTGQLVDGFWGSSCDADEREEGGFFNKAVVPQAVLAKAHMPDLALVVPAFNVESIESNAEEKLRSRLSRKVEFESIDFNQRFLATVPSEYDPIALRELFSPMFLDWVTTIDNEIDFGINDRQLWFLWRLRERSGAELKEALENGGQLFERLRSEMEEHGLHTYAAGPWHAGLEPFPDAGGPQAG